MMVDLRREDGFTLVELLVAAAMSIIVLLGLSTILITTVDQTQRVGAQVDATRQARTALATIENELHSTCVGGGVAPIQPNSTGTDLYFISYMGTSDAVGSSPSTMPVYHDLSFTNGTLVDKTYAASNGPGGGYVHGASTGSVELLANVSPLGGAPVFQYFAYQSYGPAADGNYYWTIPDGSNPQPITGATMQPSPLNTPLSTNWAASAVEVLISLNVGSTQRVAGSVPTDPVTDSISLRLTPPPNYTSTASASADFAPCQ